MDMISKLSILKDNGIRFITFEDFKEEYKLNPTDYGREFFLIELNKKILLVFNENVSLKNIFKHYNFIKKEIEKNTLFYFLY